MTITDDGAFKFTPEWLLETDGSSLLDVMW
jgi:hypothetical protein